MEKTVPPTDGFMAMVVEEGIVVVRVETVCAMSYTLQLG